MGRPTITQAVAVNADGHLLLWIDGELSGEPGLLANVRRAADLRLSTRLSPGTPYIVANLHEPLGATAALLQAAVGRTLVLEAPANVLACLADTDVIDVFGMESADV